jgi:hypothetical protein
MALSRLYAAVTRKGERGKVYEAGEVVSMKDAIRNLPVRASWFRFSCSCWSHVPL